MWWYINRCIYIIIEEGCVYEECPVSLLCGSTYVNTCIYIEEGCVYEECPVSLLCGSTYVNTCIYIEEGCVYEECPVSLLCGENVEYICSLMDGEVLYLTNYRLLATQEAGLYSVSA